MLNLMALPIYGGFSLNAIKLTTLLVAQQSGLAVLANPLTQWH